MEKLVAVCGPGNTATAEIEALAEEIGRELARAGFGIVCGGRGGVMEAACRGAKTEGGLTVGILPTYDHAQANPYVDIVICTGLNEARNMLVAATGLALIAVGGEWGTLSEIALALKINRPVISLAGYGWDVRRQSWRDPVPNFLHYAANPKEAVRLAIDLISKVEKEKEKNKG